MNEILKLLNALTADELDSVLMRGGIMLEKKRKEEAEAAIREQERIRLEKIEQEKKRLEEIAELQRKIEELQKQKIIIPEAPGTATGDGFVMYDKPKTDAAKPAAPVQPAKPETPALTRCPHCNLFISAGREVCSNCGKPVNAAAKTPSQPNVKVPCPHCHTLNVSGSVYCSNCGQKMTTKHPVTPPQPAAPVQPATPAQPATPPQAAAAQVRYADESMKKWEKLPGEETKCKDHSIKLLQPDGGKKFAYYMEVTNKRILFTRENAFTKDLGLAGALGGGLVGGLLMEGVKAAAGAGPKPWLEIPLTAVSNCGLQGKKEFFIVADQTYVLKNFGYEKFLPALVAEAKK